MSVSALIGDYDGKFVGFSFMSFSDNLRIRQKANSADRRMVGARFVSLFNSGLALQIGDIWTFSND
jgi:hypothetical protein